MSDDGIECEKCAIEAIPECEICEKEFKHIQQENSVIQRKRYCIGIFIFIMALTIVIAIVIYKLSMHLN
jgi:hypothetical protein